METTKLLNRKSGLKGLRTSLTVKPHKAVVCVVPAFVMIMLASVIPAIVVTVLTFTDFEGEFAVMEWVGATNWINLFNGTLGGSQGGAKVLWSAVGKTLLYGALVIVPMQIIALVCALIVNRRLYRTSGFFRALYFMPNILGVTVVTTIWNMVFSTNNGPIYQICRALGIETSLLGDSRIALFLISVASVWAGFGFSMAIYLAGLQGVSKDYYEAAEVDGAKSAQKFFKITLPLIVPSITVCIWTALNTTLHVSDYIFLMNNGAAGTTTLGFYIFDMIFNNRLNYGQTSVISLVFFVFCSVIMMTVNKLLSRLEVES